MHGPVLSKKQGNDVRLMKDKWLAIRTGLASPACNIAWYIVFRIFNSTASTEDVFQFDINDSTGALFEVSRNAVLNFPFFQ